MPIDLDRGHGELVFGPDGVPDFEERMRAAREIVLRYGRGQAPRGPSLHIGYEAVEVPVHPAQPRFQPPTGMATPTIPSLKQAWARSAVRRVARVRLSAAPP
jgi:hypothetical protein